MNPREILDNLSVAWSQIVDATWGRVETWLQDNSYDSTLADVPDTVIMLLVTATLVMSLHSGIYRAVLGYAVTFVHELGHALAGLTVGHRVQGLRINKDLSGETFTSGGGLLQSTWITWWGYPFPALMGNIMIVCAYNGWTRIAFILLMVSLVGTFVISQGLTTVLVVVTGWSTIAMMLAWAPPMLVNMLGLALGLILIAGAVRMIFVVLNAHITREGVEQSDAYALGRRTLIPGILWALAMLAFILWMAWSSLSRLYLSIS